MQTNFSIRSSVIGLIVAIFAAVPSLAFAQELDLYAPAESGSWNAAMVMTAIFIFGAILARIWMGIMNASLIHEEPIDSIERRQPYLPSVKTITTTVVCTAAMFILSLKTMGGIVPFDGSNATTKAAVFFSVIGIVSVIAQFIWKRARNYVFAFTVGTVVTFILLGFQQMLFVSGVQRDPFFMTLGILCIILAWRFLFGPWRPEIKAAVLGTFLFWVGLHLFLGESSEQQTARLLATGIALVPAVIWCLLFLREHRQQLSLVILMFFAGMLSTAPILFYDSLVRHNVQLNFFLFTIVPENFTRTSNAFVAGNLTTIADLRSTLLATLLAFLIVGVIEEFSKFWVLKKSGERFFSCIDDVLQLGIIVAIGFAFAENVMNPTYFMSFVREFLIAPDTPEWGSFIGNILGRAILTNMVHILATGVLAYFYGLALFAEPVLSEDRKGGKIHVVSELMHRLFRFPRVLVFRRRVLLQGFVSAVVLHGLFNFLVTLPDLLPGNPHTIGDLVGAGEGSFLHYIALLIIPSLFYVVGGFWLISYLFYRKECIKERGCLVRRDTFVPENVACA